MNRVALTTDRHRIGHGAILICGTLLLFSAASKTKKVYDNSVLSGAWLAIDVLQVLLIMYELSLVLWLISQKWSRGCKISLIVTFLLFCAASMYFSLSGSESCGCFGDVHSHPFMTIVIDISVVVLLCADNSSSPAHRKIRYTIRLLAASVAIVAFATVILGASPLMVSANRFLAATIGNHGLYEHPELWRGKRLPLLELIDVESIISSGTWDVVFVRPHCGRCQNRLLEFSARAAEYQRRNIDIRSCIIEVPPYGVSERIDVVYCLSGRLQKELEWGFTTPLTVRIVGGIVSSVASE